MRTDEAREDTFILITSGKASDILASKFPTGSIPAFEITQIVLTNYVNSLAVVTTAFDYAKDRASQIPMTVMGRVEQIKEEDGSLIVYKGAGLIHPHQVMDYLTETETKGYNWLTGRFGTGLIVATFKGGSEKFTYEIVRNRTSLTPKLVDGQLTFVFSAEVTGRITKLESSKSLNDPFSWPEYLHAIEEGIKREVRAAVDKAKEQGDFIGLGHLVMRRLPKFWRENEAQWEQIWPEAPFVFDIKVGNQRRRQAHKILVRETLQVEQKTQVPSNQIVSLVTVFLIGTITIISPANEMGKYSYISVLLAFLIYLVVLGLYYLLSSLEPDKNLFAIHDAAYGRIIGTIVNLFSTLSTFSQSPL